MLAGKVPGMGGSQLAGKNNRHIIIKLPSNWKKLLFLHPFNGPVPDGYRGSG